MKDDDEVEVEVLTLSEQFCWDIESEIAHGYRHMIESLENNFQLCDDNEKLKSINSNRIKLRNKLVGSVYHAWFPNYLINNQLKKCLRIYYDSLSMSNAIALKYSHSIEYGKYNYNKRTRTLTVCPLSHYQEVPEDFSFSSLDDFKPLVKYIEWIKMILYLNQLAAEMNNTQIADQLLQDLPKPNCTNENESSKDLQAKPIYKIILKILAFTYRGAYLSYVLRALKKAGAICEEVTLEQFQKLFSGHEVATPIKWYKEQGDLKDFIQTAINSGKLTYPAQQHWNIAAKCFIKPDGSAFNVPSLKVSQPTTSSYKYIKAANLF